MFKEQLLRLNFLFLTTLRAWWLYSITSLIFLFQTFYKGVPGDLEVFYRAGIDVRKLQDPWVESIDPIHFQYLYGPINSIICSTFSLFGNRGMYFIICLTSILAVPSLFYLSGKIFGLNLSTKRLSQYSSLLMLTFPFRANLEYGQFVLPYTSLLMLLLFLLQKSPNVVTQISIGVGAVTLVDFKPHIFFVWLVLFILKGRKFVNLGVIIGVGIQITILKIITGSYFPTEWFDRMINRGKGSDGLSGFYNLKALVINVVESPDLTVALFLLYPLVLLAVLRYSSLSIIETLLLCHLALFPIMHPQDFVFLFVLLITLVSYPMTSKKVLFCLGLGLTWSTNLIVIFCVTAIVICIFFSWNRNIKLGFPLLGNMILLVFPVISIDKSLFLFQSVDSYRIFMNVICILGVLSILSRQLTRGSLKSLIEIT